MLPWLFYSFNQSLKKRLWFSCQYIALFLKYTIALRTRHTTIGLFSFEKKHKELVPHFTTTETEKLACCCYFFSLLLSILQTQQYGRRPFLITRKETKNSSSYHTTIQNFIHYMRAITLIIPYMKGVVENAIYYIQYGNVKIIIYKGFRIIILQNTIQIIDKFVICMLT